MSNLNVTEGEWFVQRTGGIDGIHVLSYPKLDHQCCVVRTESLHDAYLIAQAKNIYKNIREDIEILKRQADKFACGSYEFRSIYLRIKSKEKLLNACKPPKDRV